jgi:hypothetical protein
MNFKEKEEVPKGKGKPRPSMLSSLSRTNLDDDGDDNDGGGGGGRSLKGEKKEKNKKMGKEEVYDDDGDNNNNDGDDGDDDDSDDDDDDETRTLKASMSSLPPSFYSQFFTSKPKNDLLNGGTSSSSSSTTTTSSSFSYPTFLGYALNDPIFTTLPLFPATQTSSLTAVPRSHPDAVSSNPNLVGVCCVVCSSCESSEFCVFVSSELCVRLF